MICSFSSVFKIYIFLFKISILGDSGGHSLCTMVLWFCKYLCDIFLTCSDSSFINRRVKLYQKVTQKNFRQKGMGMYSVTENWFLYAYRGYMYSNIDHICHMRLHKNHILSRSKEAYFHAMPNHLMKFAII